MSNVGSSLAPVYDADSGYCTYNEGWCHINYTHMKTSMTEADIDFIRIGAKKYRIAAQGFDIKRINCIQQNVVASANTTNINASFQSAPSLLLFKDTDNDLFSHTYVGSIAMSAIQAETPVWKDVNNTSNKNYTTPFANPVTDGALTNVKVSMQGVVQPQLIDQATNFTLMHGGDIEWLTAGKTASHSWTNDNPAWFSPNIGQSALQLGNNEFDDSMNFITNTVEMYENCATGVPHCFANPPTMCLLRVPPVCDLLGPISMIFEVQIEYWCDIEWVPGRYIQTLNNSNAAPAAIALNRRFYLANKRHLVNLTDDIPTREAPPQDGGPAAKKLRTVPVSVAL